MCVAGVWLTVTRYVLLTCSALFDLLARLPAVVCASPQLRSHLSPHRLRHLYRPMPLLLQYTAALVLNISISARCATRWNQATTAVNNASYDASWGPWGLSGLDGWHEGKLYQFNSSVLIVHVGKAGGGTIIELLHRARVAFDQVHVHPVPLLKLHSHPYIVVVTRDPVARFISAYNWGITQRKPWAMRLSACYDVDQFAMAFAYHRINPSLRSARTPCDTLSDEIDSWTSAKGEYTGAFTFGHIKMDGCFYMGGCIGDSALLSKRMFVVRTEMMSEDAGAMLSWLNASGLGAQMPHGHDNSATTSNYTTKLQPFAQHALEVALVDEYQIANRILQMSINAPRSAYCVTFANIHGLRCSEM